MTPRIRYVALAALLLFACAPRMVQAQWMKTSGPRGGMVTALFCSGTYILAGIQNAGVFRSTDKGATWTESNTGLTTANIGTLTVSGNYLLVGKGDSGVFRSSDNGATWSDANNGMPSRNVYGFAVAGNDLYMAASDLNSVFYLFHSTDHGGHWNSIVTDKMYYTGGFLGANDTYLYSAVGSNVYRTSNLGASWDSLYRMGGSARSMIVSGANIFIGTLRKGVVRSIDGGVQWAAPNIGLPKMETITISALAIKGSDLFIGFNSSLYRSSDSGASWVAASAGLDSMFVTALATDGADLYAGTYDGIYRSTDNGEHWAPASQTLTAAMITSVAAKGTNLVAATEAGTLFSSTDNGDVWTVADKFPQLNSPITSLLFRGSDLYASSQGGGVYRSADDGVHWGLASGFNWGSYDVIANDSFLFSTKGNVLRSSDSGVTWVAASTGLGGEWDYRNLAIVGDTLYAGSFSDGVFRSTNNGTYWSRAGTELSHKGIHALAASGNYVVVGLQGAIYRSFNYAASWKLADTDLSQFDILALKIIGSDWYAGTTGGIMRSIDAGKHWAPINEGLPDGMRVTAITVSGDDLVIGTSGSSVWRRPLTQIAAGVQSQLLPQLITASIHPNPVASSGMLHYHLPAGSSVSITIHDVLGRIVSERLVDAIQESGKHQMLLEAEELAAGVYLCVITAGGVAQSVRFVFAP